MEIVQSPEHDIKLLRISQGIAPQSGLLPI